VFGSGTVLDTARLRYLLSRRLHVSTRSVHALVAGEHGDSEIVLWSSANVGGVPLAAYDVEGRSIRASEYAEIRDAVAGSAYKVIEGKGATNYAIGLAMVRHGGRGCAKRTRAVSGVSAPSPLGREWCAWPTRISNA